MTPRSRFAREPCPRCAHVSDGGSVLCSYCRFSDHLGVGVHGPVVKAVGGWTQPGPTRHRMQALRTAGEIRVFVEGLPMRLDGNQWMLVPDQRGVWRTVVVWADPGFSVVERDGAYAIRLLTAADDAQ